MEKLFENFDSISFKEWTDLITHDLKGKSLDVLNSKPESDLTIKAYHHRDEKVIPLAGFTKPNNDWRIRKTYSDTSNTEILSDLNEGVDAIGLTYSAHFQSQSKGILFDHITSDVKFERDFPSTELNLAKSTHLNFDLIAQEIEDGSWFSTKEIFIAYFQKTKEHKNLWVSGNAYGEAGSTTIQELAFTLSHLNEYVDMLVNAGESLEQINQNLCIELSVTENYFVNIAKMRVIRSLVRGVFEAYDANHKHLPITLYATTSKRHLALNDSNSNLLRQTTQAMSAVLGGCNVLTVQALVTDNPDQDGIHARMAKNIQLVLREEAYFDKVVDPSSGSYYLESLSNELLEKSWTLFKKLENSGGFGECIQNNTIQNQIEESKSYRINQLNDKTATFLGVNKHPSSLEPWKKTQAINPSKQKTFKAIIPFRLENHFKQTVEA